MGRCSGEEVQNCRDKNERIQEPLPIRLPLWEVYISLTDNNSQQNLSLSSGQEQQKDHTLKCSTSGQMNTKKYN
jgi:hypothetical protein